MSIEIPLPHMTQGQTLLLTEPSFPMHPSSSLSACKWSLNFLHHHKKYHLLPDVPCLQHSPSCSSPAGLLPAKGKQLAQVSVKTVSASRTPLTPRALAKSCRIFSCVCLSLAGKCKHQAPKHQPSLCISLLWLLVFQLFSMSWMWLIVC